MKVTFWPVKNEGVRYVRAEMPGRALGVPVVVPRPRESFPAGYEAWLGERQRDSLGVFGLLANRARIRGALQHPGGYVLEIDDDYTEWHPGYVAEGWTRGLPPRDDSFTSSVELHRMAAAEARAVIVSTPFLAERYGELNERVFVCPNAVDPADWDELPERDETFNVVFAGALRSADLGLVGRALRWATDQPGVRVTLMGGTQSPAPKAVVMPLTSLDEYRRNLVAARPDVGLRPLRRTKFARSKSDLKVLEYAMAGAMSIVAPLDPYSEWEESGLVEFASSPSEWLRQVQWAVRNRDEVRGRAAATRADVLARRTISETVWKWRQALTDA